MKEEHTCSLCKNFALVQLRGEYYHCCLERRVFPDITLPNDCKGYKYYDGYFPQLQAHDKAVRNKAIDEFANRLYSKIKAEIDDCADELDWIDEIAEQMKGGAE